MFVLGRQTGTTAHEKWRPRFIYVFVILICLKFKPLTQVLKFWSSLTWSIPHWGWRRSFWYPKSCSAACSGSPQCWQTDKMWSSWWRWCFCPAGCTCLFQSETSRSTGTDRDTVGQTGTGLTPSTQCFRPRVKWERTDEDQMVAVCRRN